MWLRLKRGGPRLADVIWQEPELAGIPGRKGGLNAGISRMLTSRPGRSARHLRATRMFHAGLASPLYPHNAQMAPFIVKIKHAGKIHDVDLDVDQPPTVFKEAIYQKTGVPPDRMKVMIKGGILKVRYQVTHI